MDIDMEIEREFGKIEAKVEELEKKVDKMQASLDRIVETLSEAKGGWKTLVAVGTIAGGLGAAATKVVGILLK